VTAPVETKVRVSTLASMVAALVMGLVVHWRGSPVSGPTGDLITTVVTGAVTFAAGWLAKHTPRPAVQSAAPSDPRETS